MASTRTARRSGGRAARVAARSAPEPQVNPAPPGQRGGAYRPLSEPDLQTIHRAALDLLADLGMGEAPPALVEAACARGAEVNGLGRLCFPRALVEDIVAQAPKTLVLHGRDPKHDIEIGGARVLFGTGGAAVQTLDIDTGRYRPATLRDLYDFARLADRLSNISWFTRCSVATDVPDIRELDLNTVFAIVKGTSKPVGTSITVGAHVAPVVEMLDIAMGGAGRFAERPCLKVHISPVVSPLRYGEDAVDVTQACVAHGVPINCIIGAQPGATGPAVPASFLVQSLAETFAGLALVHAFAPGHPVIFSNWPLVVDLRTGAFAGGGPESALLNAAAAQLSNWLGLPSGVACSMSDAKAVDAQMGAEKALTALSTALAGANMIYESAGMMASLLGASFEAFVLDDEMLGTISRVLRGVEVTDETLGLDAIRATVLGEGHFLGGAETMAAMQRDYLYPRLADRDPPVTWAEKGSADAWSRARDKARTTLAEHHPTHLSAKAEAEIRGKFPIRLP